MKSSYFYPYIFVNGHLKASHILENLLCAQLLAIDCLNLTSFVTNSQLWRHWCPVDKSSCLCDFYIILVKVEVEMFIVFMTDEEYLTAEHLDDSFLWNLLMYSQVRLIN